MNLLEKSLSDIQPGARAPEHGANAFDYSHVLEAHHQAALPGARVIVKWAPGSYGEENADDPSGWLTGEIRGADGKRLGSMQADLYSKDKDGRKFLGISTSEVRGVPREVNGRRMYWGRKLYEAMMAHAKNTLGATHVGGGAHSTYASRAHQWLSDRHNMLYDPTPNLKSNMELADPAAAEFGFGNYFNDEDEWGAQSDQPQSNDDRFGPYAYTLKSETFAKAEDLGSVPVGDKKNEGGPNHRSIHPAVHYSYDHILTPEQREKGYQLDVIEHFDPRGMGIGSKFGLLIAKVRKARMAPNDHASIVESFHGSDGKVSINFARTDKAHRGQRLGHAAYEALFAHAKNHLNADEVEGDSHSTAAHVVHRALATKYGLKWLKEPTQQQPSWNPEHSQGSFDAAYSPYALKLHEMVSSGALEIPLAKEEDESDPLVARLVAARRNVSYYADPTEVSLILREQGVEKKHLLAAMRIFRTLANSEMRSIFVNHPLFDTDVFHEATVGSDADFDSNRARRQLLYAMTRRDTGQYPPIAQSNPDWVFNQLQAQYKHDEAIPSGQKTADIRSATLRTIIPFATTNISILSDDQLASIDLATADDLGHVKRTFFDALQARYNGAFPDSLKNSILGYAKNILGRAEKATNVYRDPGASIVKEADRALPFFQKVVASGLPTEQTTARVTKTLFHSLLALAPNFPKKKAMTLLDHFTSPEGLDKMKNSLVRQMAAKLWCNSPHLSDENWTSLVGQFGSHFPVSELISNPRFTMDLAKTLFSKHQDWNLLGALRDAGKVTPELGLFAAQASTVAIEKNKADAETQRNQATVVDRPDQLGPYDGRYARNERGALVDYNGLPHPSYLVNPYAYGDGSLTNVLQYGGATAYSDELFDYYMDRHRKMVDYRPPELEGDPTFERNFPKTTIVGIDNYYRGRHMQRPLDSWFTHLNSLPGGATPHAEKALADYCLHPNITSDNANTFLSKVKDEESIHKIINETTKVGHIGTLLKRADAKPEWVQAAMARPEFHAVPPATDLRYRHVDQDPAQRQSINGPSGLDFHTYLRNYVVASPAFPTEALAGMIATAPNAAQLNSLAGSPAIKPEHVSQILKMVPSEFGDYEYTPDGLRRVVDGNYVRTVTNRGTVNWDRTAHRSIVKNLLTRNYKKLPPQQWEDLQASGFLTPDANSENYGIVDLALRADSTAPNSALNHIYDTASQDSSYGSDYRTKVFSHPNCDPGLLQRVVETPYTNAKEMWYAFNPILERAQVPPELVTRMIERARTFAPEVPRLDPTGVRFVTPNDPEEHAKHFYTTLADSGHAPMSWLREVHAEIQRAQAEHVAALPHSSFNYGDTKLGNSVKASLGRLDPDVKYTRFPKILARVGAAAWRKLRDVIESVGGKMHLGEIQKDPVLGKLPGIDRARIMRDMTPEELARIPEKNRPKVPVKKKTDFVSSEGVQKIIDATPTAPPLNVSFSKWRSHLQSHGYSFGHQDDIFQFNHTTDHLAQIQAAGLMPIYQIARKILNEDFSLHPMTEEGLGWIRYNGISPSNTIHITEIQSDLRPLGGSWAASLAGSKPRQVPDPQNPGQMKTLPAWSGQVIDRFVRNHRWGGNFPAAEMDKINDILWGKGVDPDVAMLEGLHEHFRNQGHHNVTIHVSGLQMAGHLRHGHAHGQVPEAERPNLKGVLPQPNPHGLAPEAGHFAEAYEEIPKKLGYDMDAAKYGDEETQKNPTFMGWPYHTSPVRKMEDLLKGIETLPSLPFSHSSGGDRVYDASHYLTPEHKKLGYTLQIRTGEGPYGPFSIADVRHGSHIVGGATMYISDQSLKGKEKRKYGQLDMVGLKDQHIGKKLGLPMYEALMASAKKHHGCTHVRGLQHSSMAHSVHQQLATKHGLEYDSQPNFPSVKYPTKEAWESAPRTSMDGKWGPYSYPV